MAYVFTNFADGRKLFLSTVSNLSQESCDKKRSINECGIHSIKTIEEQKIDDRAKRKNNQNEYYSKVEHMQS